MRSKNVVHRISSFYWGRLLATAQGVNRLEEFAMGGDASPPMTNLWSIKQSGRHLQSLIGENFLHIGPPRNWAVNSSVCNLVYIWILELRAASQMFSVTLDLLISDVSTFNWKWFFFSLCNELTPAIDQSLDLVKLQKPSWLNNSKPFRTLCSSLMKRSHKF